MVVADRGMIKNYTDGLQTVYKCVFCKKKLDFARWALSALGAITNDCANIRRPVGKCVGLRRSALKLDTIRHGRR